LITPTNYCYVPAQQWSRTAAFTDLPSENWWSARCVATARRNFYELIGSTSFESKPSNRFVNGVYFTMLSGDSVDLRDRDGMHQPAASIGLRRFILPTIATQVAISAGAAYN